MAGTFSPKDVGKLLIAADNRAGDTISDYLANAVAANLEAAVIGADGQATALNQPFKVYVKESDADYGINFSDVIVPGQVKYVKANLHSQEESKVVRITGFTGTVRDDATYRISIRKYDHIQSPNNFRYIHSFYVSPADASSITWATVLTELKANFDAALKRENSQSEFDISIVDNTLQISNKPQPVQLGKKQGLPIKFDIEVSVKDNAPANLSGVYNLGLLDTEVLFDGSEGIGTGKQIANLEYFLKGYDNADYGREVGFPNNFDPSYLASTSGTYNSVQIGFYSQRDTVNVERQPKELTVVFNEAYTAPVAEVSTIQVTAAASAAGTATVDLDGVTINLPLTASTIATNAAEIAATIDALDGYAATTDGVDTVTITALVKESQTNIATYAAGTATDSAATLATVTNGVDEAATFTEINAFLAQLRTPLGSAIVPADFS